MRRAYARARRANAFKVPMSQCSFPQLAQNFAPVRGAPHSVQKPPVAIGTHAGAWAPVGGAAGPSPARILSKSVSSAKVGRSLGSGAQQRFISSATSDIAGASGTARARATSRPTRSAARCGGACKRWRVSSASENEAAAPAGSSCLVLRRRARACLRRRPPRRRARAHRARAHAGARAVV